MIKPMFAYVNINCKIPSLFCMFVYFRKMSEKPLQDLPAALG